MGVRFPRELWGRSSLYFLRQSSISRLVSSSFPNQWAFRHSFLRLALMLSINAFSTCLPGRMKSNRKPCRYAADPQDWPDVAGRKHPPQKGFALCCEPSRRLRQTASCWIPGTSDYSCNPSPFLSRPVDPAALVELFHKLPHLVICNK